MTTNFQKYAKNEIAFHQIETALRLFFEEGDLFSIITLAGAAEEILGQLLQEKDRNSGLAGLFTSIFEIMRPKSRKNEEDSEFLRHETDDHVHMDPYREAVFLLGRAIDDYQTLTGALSTDMLKFNSEIRLENS
jgi:hypothetical protein